MYQLTETGISGNSADDVVTFFEVWFLRQFRDHATSANGLRIRNAVEDLILDDTDYWANLGNSAMYQAACTTCNLPAWSHG